MNKGKAAVLIIKVIKYYYTGFKHSITQIKLKYDQLFFLNDIKGYPVEPQPSLQLGMHGFAHAYLSMKTCT